MSHATLLRASFLWTYGLRTNHWGGMRQQHMESPSVHAELGTSASEPEPEDARPGDVCWTDRGAWVRAPRPRIDRGSL